MTDYWSGLLITFAWIFSAIGVFGGTLALPFWLAGAFSECEDLKHFTIACLITILLFLVIGGCWFTILWLHETSF